MLIDLKLIAVKTSLKALTGVHMNDSANILKVHLYMEREMENIYYFLVHHKLLLNIFSDFVTKG